MNSPCWFHLLTQAGYAVITHDRCVQCIEALPRVWGRMGCLAREFDCHSVKENFHILKKWKFSANGVPIVSKPPFRFEIHFDRCLHLIKCVPEIYHVYQGKRQITKCKNHWKYLRFNIHSFLLKTNYLLLVKDMG